jgi:hypothetical protein
MSTDDEKRRLLAHCAAFPLFAAFAIAPRPPRIVREPVDEGELQTQLRKTATMLLEWDHQRQRAGASGGRWKGPSPGVALSTADVGLAMLEIAEGLKPSAPLAEPDDARCTAQGETT